MYCYWWKNKSNSKKIRHRIFQSLRVLFFENYSSKIFCLNILFHLVTKNQYSHSRDRRQSYTKIEMTHFVSLRRLSRNWWNQIFIFRSWHSDEKSGLKFLGPTSQIEAEPSDENQFCKIIHQKYQMFFLIRNAVFAKHESLLHDFSWNYVAWVFQGLRWLMTAEKGAEKYSCIFSVAIKNSA